jgi:Protein of unknown function (DUF3102)
MTEAEIKAHSDKLAAQINAEHKAVVKANQSSLEHAIAAGEILRAAKKKYGSHGKWEKWLKDNCPDISEETARLYMRLANPANAPKLEAAAEQNGNAVADLSVRGAAKLLSKPQTPAQRAARAAPRPAPAPSVSTSCGPCTMLYQLSPNSAPNEVFDFLTDTWDEEQLAELTSLLVKHVTPEVEEETEEDTPPVREPQLEEV